MQEITKRENLTVAIQAGGESRRMGRSKAFVSFLGEPLIMRSIRRLEPLAGEMLITTNEPERYHVIVDQIAANGIRLYRDLAESRGSLNGLYTALIKATLPFVAVIACDMIFPSAPLFSAELDCLMEGDCDVAVPRNEHGYEPFHAVYRRETCLAFIEKALTVGETRAGGWYDQARVCEFTTQMVLAADSRGGCFINANTPRELAAVEKRILEEGMPFKVE